MRSTPKPIASFRLYPGKGAPKRYRLNKKRYFIVKTYRTIKEMHEAGKTSSCNAVVQPMTIISYRKSRRGIEKPYLGDALFWKGKLGVGLIAHESLHMSLEFLRRQHGGFQFEDPNECHEQEEELAYVLYEIARKLCIGFVKHKAL